MSLKQRMSSDTIDGAKKEKIEAIYELSKNYNSGVIPTERYKAGCYSSSQQPSNMFPLCHVSLKGKHRTTSLREDAKIAVAFDDYKNGKKGAERRLAKYVDSGMISTEEYKTLIDKYGVFHRINKEKRKREASEERKEWLCIIVSIVVMFSSMLCTLPCVMKDYEKGGAVCYFFLWIWAFSYIGLHPYKEIAKLKRENEILKEKTQNLQTNQ